jgi:hypothetical protein
MSSLSCRAVAIAIGLGLALVGSAWAQVPWIAPESEKSEKSPVAASPKAAEQGKKVAQVNCGLVPRPRRKGQRPGGDCAEPQARGLDLEEGSGRNGRGDFLEDHDRPGAHAVVEAPPRERPLGPRSVHPHAQEVA